MKRFAAGLLSFLLLLGLLPAGAQEGGLTLSKVFEVRLGEILDGSNQVAFREEGFGLMGIMNPDGSVAVPLSYYNLDSDNSLGYIVAYKLDDLNGKGVIDPQGNEVVPFEYGEIDVLSPQWLLGVRLEEATADNYDYRALFGGYGSGYYLVAENVF